MSRVSVNVLCLVGAAMGALAVLVTWCFVTASTGGPVSNANPLSTGPLCDIMSSGQLFAFSFLVVGGAAVAFISPLGGTLQVSGVLLFLYCYTTVPNPFLIPELRLIPGFGAYVAIISAAFVLVSFVWPLGFGYEKPINLCGRLLTVCPSKNRFDQGASMVPSSKEVMKVIGVALIFGGVGASSYALGVAHMMDGFAVDIAPDAHLLLNLLGVVGALIGAVGCAFLFVSKRHTLAPGNDSR